MVSHVEISQQLTQDGKSIRVIKILEISRNQTLESKKQSIDHHHRPSAPNQFERLPDELLERIINFAGIRNTTSAVIKMDPYEAGWKDEEEVIQDAIGFRTCMATLRLVCWRFFHLATPLFLRRLVICDPNWSHRPLDLIQRLTQLLSTTTTRSSTRTSNSNNAQERLSINQIPKHPSFQSPYGHHVRQLIISNRTIPARLVCQVLETIHSLLPNLSSLGGLSLSHMPRLLSPTIRFPRLLSITGIDLAASSELWTLTQDHYPLIDSTETQRLLAGPNQFISQEVFLGILNHHPHISYLSCRGLQIDEAGANRLSALLRANQYSIALMPPSLRTEEFTGLKMLHIGLNSVIDLQLVRLLPHVAPHLQQLHIDAGCKLEDKSTDSSRAWSMNELLGMLPRLTHLTFIAQHNLPSRHGSLGWASSNELLRFSPCAQSLNLRMDSFTTAKFFDSLIDDTITLCQLNVWHRPTLNLNPASESWSIISFDSPKRLLKLGHAVRTMKKAGLEWPTIDNQQRDLWLKLKALTELDLFEEHRLDDSCDDL